MKLTGFVPVLFAAFLAFAGIAQAQIPIPPAIAEAFKKEPPIMVEAATIVVLEHPVRINRPDGQGGWKEGYLPAGMTVAIYNGSVWIDQNGEKVLAVSSNPPTTFVAPASTPAPAPKPIIIIEPLRREPRQPSSVGPSMIAPARVTEKRCRCYWQTSTLFGIGFGSLFYVLQKHETSQELVLKGYGKEGSSRAARGVFALGVGNMAFWGTLSDHASVSKKKRAYLAIGGMIGAFAVSSVMK